jgi:hypothetical protein
MGTRGPVPSRSADRRRRNKPDGGVEVVSAPAGADAEPPKAEDYWHPIARDWYLSLAQSGQCRWYEPSDWQRARFVAEAMHRNLDSGRFSAQLFAAVSSSMSELLDTEGSRRRVRIELERAPLKPNGAGGDAAVADLDAYRAAL